MFKNRLSLTVFGRFLEGNLGHPNLVKLKLGSPNMVKLKFPSKNRPNMVNLSSISVIFIGFTFFPCWRACGWSKNCHLQEPELSRGAGYVPLHRLLLADLIFYYLCILIRTSVFAASLAQKWDILPSGLGLGFLDLVGPLLLNFEFH